MFSLMGLQEIKQIPGIIMNSAFLILKSVYYLSFWQGKDNYNKMIIL